MTEEWKTPLFDINLGEEEKKLLLSAFDSGWISMGPRTREFEMLWEEAYKQPSLAVSSCTSALSLALNALNISSGQEVILPSLTFVADANTVFHCGATPVFSDVGSLE